MLWRTLGQLDTLSKEGVDISFLRFSRKDQAGIFQISKIAYQISARNYTVGINSCTTKHQQQQKDDWMKVPRATECHSNYKSNSHLHYLHVGLLQQNYTKLRISLYESGLSSSDAGSGEPLDIIQSGVVVKLLQRKASVKQDPPKGTIRSYTMGVKHS